MINLDSILPLLKEKIELHTTLVKTNDHLKHVSEQLKTLYQTRDKLVNKLQKEENDVKQLEGKGVKTLFYQVLGSKEKQLEKERQEYLAASLEYNNCQDSIELLEFERDILKEKVEGISVVAENIATLKQKREKEILQSNTEAAIKAALSRNLIRTDDLLKERQEYIEALHVGKASLQEVTLIYNHLQKAQNWGQWSNQRGSSRMKYNAIDRASKHLPRAQMHLNNFKRELLDVGINDNRLILTLNEFSGFNLMFFDNIITDWILQQKLMKSIYAVKQTLAVIDSLLIHIDGKLRDLDQGYREFIMEKDEILMHGDE